ncbi:MAG TPA: amidase family protein, partial [Acetobacteraceae bacterium]|nr:amidase family protein [Acetobacteraceae bacterium]
FDARTSEYDCVLMPTVPIVPPRVAELDDERAYNRINLLILRNTALGNFLDRCAISLPCHGAGEAPVGLMLMGETLGDARLFRIAAGVEAALA